MVSWWSAVNEWVRQKLNKSRERKKAKLDSSALHTVYVRLKKGKKEKH